MTDEDRKKAELFLRGLIESNPLQFRNKSPDEWFYRGYAAACEAKRAEYGRDIGSEAFDEIVEKLEAERARSAKLFEALNRIGSGAYEDNYIRIAWDAVKTYEASRD